MASVVHTGAFNLQNAVETLLLDASIERSVLCEGARLRVQPNDAEELSGGEQVWVKPSSDAVVQECCQPRSFRRLPLLEAVQLQLQLRQVVTARDQLKGCDT